MGRLVTNRVLLFTILVTLLNSLALVIVTEAKRVRVIDGLSNGKELQLHCKSKHHDLGIQILKPGEFFEFKFNAMPFTLYFCGFVFDNKLHWFDIYKFYRDLIFCYKLIMIVGGRLERLVLVCIIPLLLLIPFAMIGINSKPN